MNNVKNSLIAILLFMTSMGAFSQNNEMQLAQQYYAQGEFAKASDYYERLYKKNPSYAVFTRYFECLVKIQEDKKAEKLIQKQIKLEPDKLSYQFQYADFLKLQNREKEAERIYQDLINEKTASTLTVKELVNSFKDINRLDLARQTLTKARKKWGVAFPLNIEFAQLEYAENKFDAAFDELLDYLDKNPAKSEDIKAILSEWMDNHAEDNLFQEALKVKLIKNVQKNGDNFINVDLLIWYFTQKKDFETAFLQVKALDKREKGGGKRIYDLGWICLQNNDYPTAIKCFEYIQSLPDSYLKEDAKKAILKIRYLHITQDKNATNDEIATTVQAYEKAVNDGKGFRLNYDLVMELAEIDAYYANRADEAVRLLEQLVKTQGLTDMQVASAKMLLADIDVLKDAIWDASILYMQIDRDFKYEPIGFEAKFKNARIFYYSGDFKFAQSQLDVLKKSTSKLIANDAMKLSILITDNFGLDSNYQAMLLFANADLLLEQHLYNRAFQLYDSIISTYPESGLLDEIDLRKAKAMMNLGKWEKAISYLNDIVQYHAFDILIDDALYYLGIIYQEHKNDPEKAMEYYKRILMEHSDSLYGVEVRERIRKLRGES